MASNMQSQQVKLFKKGKVRDVYDLDKNLLIVATDRISCFDVVLPTLIPDKGKILTQLSLFWFNFFKGRVANHLVSTELSHLPESFQDFKDGLIGRFMIVKKCEVIPFECVVRGYISGSAWKEYKEKKSICGINLPEGLQQSEKLPEPIFTPASKAESGHDQNVSFAYMVEAIGEGRAKRLRELSIMLYVAAASYAESKGIIIADTKFEFGIYNGEILLIDEVLTPDSSRFWPKQDFQPGRPQVSFDKQFVRDYLESLDWAKTPPAPELPAGIVAKTQEKYRQVYHMLTGLSFS